MFSNINADKDELIQLVLVGQPELRDVLLAELRQFAQRVAADYHLQAMSPEAVADYIRHRLAVAGAEREISRRRPASACIWPRAACRGSLTSSVIMLSSMPSPTASTRSMPPWSSRS